MTPSFRKAERHKAKLRCGLSGPSGSGKTYSALLLAFGLGGKVALIDTENGSGDLYSHLGEYDVLTISPPFDPQKYIDGIKAAEVAGYSVVILDSLSHAWSGEGGLLDQQGKIADTGRGNSYTAWRSITPKHNALVESMLQSKCHVIATMRSKTEYVVEKNDKGKDAPRKVGMAPIQRDGMEYEFTVFFDLSTDHTAITSKDRTSIFDGKFFKPSPETGKTLLEWLNAGTDVPIPIPTEAAPVAEGATEMERVAAEAKAIGGEKKPEEKKPANNKADLVFLKMVAEQKARVGEAKYYEILGIMGFKHSSELSGMNKINFNKALKAAPDYVAPTREPGEEG